MAVDLRGYADPQTLGELCAFLSKEIPEHEATDLICALLAFQVSEDSPPVPRSEFLLRVREPVSRSFVVSARAMMGERKAGRPLQHLTGWQYFHERFYKIDQRALVPRPETEVLLLESFKHLPEGVSLIGAEIGVGSGILSIELLLRYPGLRMVGTEISKDARELAEENFRMHLGPSYQDRFQWAPLANDSEIMEPLERFVDNQEKKFDFLVSNPPYVAPDGEATDEVFLYEPTLALFPNSPDLLLFYRAIRDQFHALVAPEGWAFLEVPHERSKEVGGLFKCILGASSQVHQDLTGRDRVILINNIT